MNLELLLGGAIGILIGSALIVLVYPRILRWLEGRLLKGGKDATE